VRWIAIALLVFAFGVASAQTVRRTVTTVFAAGDIPLWPSGDNGRNLNWILLGPTWNFQDEGFGKIYEPVIPEIDWGLFTTPRTSLGKTGFELKFGGSGEVGIRVKPFYDGGRLNYTYNAGVTLGFPRFPNPNEPITVTATLAPTGLNQLQTTSPTFGAEFEAVGRFTGNAYSQAWLFGEQLWNGNVFEPFDVGGSRYLGSYSFSVPDNLNRLIGQLNPIPIGIEAATPVLEANWAQPFGANSIRAEAFGRFLSISTDFRDWVLMLLPDPLGDIIGAILSGDYAVPFTNYTVYWDMLKADANLDVGLFGQYTLRPIFTLRLEARTPDGALVASGPPPLTFNMPQAGIRVTPILTCDFELTNTLSIGTAGRIGFYPFSGGAHGDLGFDIGSDTSVDVDFDVARLEWVGEPTAGTRLVTHTFALPQRSDRTRTLSAVGINAFNNRELPRELVFDGTPRVATVQAYATDANRTFLTLNADAEQGFRFFASNLTNWSARLIRANGTVLNLNRGSITDTRIAIQIPQAELTLGTHTIQMGFTTRNALNETVSGNWTIPLQCFAPTPSLDGQFNRRDDGVTPSGITNRIPAGSGPRTLYVPTANVFRSTQVVIDGDIVLANDITGDQAITGDNVIGFTIPASVIQELGGADYDVVLRTPGFGSLVDGTPYPAAISTPSKLFFPASRPTVSAYEIDGVRNAPLTFRGRDEWVEIVGTNFTRNSRIRLDASISGFPMALETAFTSPTTLRARIPLSVQLRIHQAGLDRVSLQVETPARTVPATASEPQIISGGISDVLKAEIDYPIPALNRLENSIGLRGSPVQRVRIFGDNIFRRTTDNEVGTIVMIGGNRAGSYSYPEGSDMIVPWVEVEMRLDMRSVREVPVILRNRTRDSFPSIFSVQNAPATLVSSSPAIFRVEPGVNPTAIITGGPFYPESVLSLNGQTTPTTGTALNQRTVSLTYETLRSLPGSTVSFQLVNPAPGGGASDPLPIILQEGDASTLRVARRSTIQFDRTSRTWRQSVLVSYEGRRDTSNGARFIVRGLPSGVTLVNADGTDADGSPFVNFSLGKSRGSEVQLSFARTSSVPIRYTSAFVWR
jgi:hypothetical protein